MVTGVREVVGGVVGEVVVGEGVEVVGEGAVVVGEGDEVVGEGDEVVVGEVESWAARTVAGDEETEVEGPVKREVWVPTMAAAAEVETARVSAQERPAVILRESFMFSSVLGNRE